tara:strand:- start:327 stop:773 length:447 start_codon:yes stop_codon:yes gene_type:complete
MICNKCGNEHNGKKKMCNSCFNEKYNKQSVRYKEKYTRIPKKELRKNICFKCQKSYPEDLEEQTVLHHMSYESNNPLDNTIELCRSCHMALHNIKKGYPKWTQTEIWVLKNYWGRVPLSKIPIDRSLRAIFTKARQMNLVQKGDKWEI